VRIEEIKGRIKNRAELKLGKPAVGPSTNREEAVKREK